MKRLCSVLLLLAVAAPGRGHFIWLVPGDSGAKKPSARVIFSDGLKHYDPDLLKNIRHIHLFTRGTGAKGTAVKYTEQKEQMIVELPEGRPQEIIGLCRYGVVKRGKDEPFLLNYYAKTFLGIGRPETPLKGFIDRPWDRLPLEVVLVLGAKGGGPARARVLWQGKPLSGAEVVLYPPNKDEVERKTDAQGYVKLEPPGGPGLYGIRARHIGKTPGKFDGKKYETVRYYSTLTFRVKTGAAKKPMSNSGKSLRAAVATALVLALPAAGKPPADPAATKLLADARAARATWHNFPGFTADVAVNVNGTIARGTATVSPKGKLTLKLDGADAPTLKWAQRTLGSIIGHRLDGGAGPDTPCAFADDVTDHPLGRAIRVLNDEFHSSYRIRDRQVIVVNRAMRDARFTITVLENRVNAEKKFLPACFVVNTWDKKTDALTASEAHHQTWQRVGGFDLPHTTTVVKAGSGKQGARSITLTNLHLAEKGR